MIIHRRLLLLTIQLLEEYLHLLSYRNQMLEHLHRLHPLLLLILNRLRLQIMYLLLSVILLFDISANFCSGLGHTDKIVGATGAYMQGINTKSSNLTSGNNIQNKGKGANLFVIINQKNLTMEIIFPKENLLRSFQMESHR